MKRPKGTIGGTPSTSQRNTTKRIIPNVSITLGTILSVPSGENEISIFIDFSGYPLP
jgi:hypothetical protein